MLDAQLRVDNDHVLRIYHATHTIGADEVMVYRPLLAGDVAADDDLAARLAVGPAEVHAG